VDSKTISASELTLRNMTTADLALVRAWLGKPHVSRWYLSGYSIDGELEDLRQSVGGEQPTEALIVLGGDHPIGWCQWYRCSDYPAHASGVGAQPGDVGIDYAIGDVTGTGRGVGTALIAALVGHVRERCPQAGVIANPDAANIASRRVLEKNGFELLGVHPVASEPSPEPMAIYRLAGVGG
jgi:RimJ/RimL family protein N-acetyltransferase